MTWLAPCPGCNTNKKADEGHHLCRECEGYVPADARVGTIATLRAQLDEAQSLVDEQAEDEGLWFQAQTAPEAYLQQELRRLHAVIEAAALIEEEPPLESLYGLEYWRWGHGCRWYDQQHQQHE